jgi:hypothetical protein
VAEPETADTQAGTQEDAMLFAEFDPTVLIAIAGSIGVALGIVAYLTRHRKGRAGSSAG